LPNPPDVTDERRQYRKSDAAIEPVGQLIDRTRRLWIIDNAEPEHRGIAKPKSQPGDKTDFRHFDRCQPPAGIDAITHRAAGKDTGPDIVADRIAGKSSKRGDSIRHFRVPNGAKREEIVKS
jgi:hypothetical protein